MMKQAVILAAGEGQRLRPFTVTRPKTMLSIAGKPVLQYVIEALAQNGIRDIIIVVGYRKEQVFDYVGNGEQFGVNVTYITQDKQLGTAHALMQVKDTVNDEFLVLPGDNLIEAGTIVDFVSVNPDSVLVKRVEDTVRYGIVNVDGDETVCILDGPDEIEGGIVNTGIYSFSKKVFDYIDDELGIPDVINDMVALGLSVKARETSGTWLDAVYPWDILTLNNAILPQLPATLGGTIEAGASVNGLVSIGKDTVIRSNSYIVGPVVIGANCDIGPNVYISSATSLGDNVVISPFSEVKNSVIGDDVSIGSGSVIQDSVIDDGCIIGGHFTACSDDAEIKINSGYHVVKVGAMLGAGCNLGSSVVAQPGVIVGNHSRIQSMKLVSGKLPDRSFVL
ncbi:bifunctional sugar-1-phosphate nucleotidylyltransferase/acetyltransferase [Chloroflexota bacterium]